MIKIAICEDEIKQQDILKDYLEKIFSKLNQEYEVYTYNSGEELLNDYPENIDIFLLDIQMDNINGMDVARNIRKIDNKNVEIIFITSLIEYMQEGYEVRAYRYLLKPIKYEDLEKHIINCVKEISENNKYIIIKEKNNTIKLTTSEITYIEVQKDDITIHTIDGNYQTKGAISKIEKELNSSNFYRCHKSFLVNLEHVEKIKQYVAILDNKEEVLISRHRFKDTKSAFFNLIGDKLC